MPKDISVLHLYIYGEQLIAERFYLQEQDNYQLDVQHERYTVSIIGNQFCFESINSEQQTLKFSIEYSSNFDNLLVKQLNDASGKATDNIWNVNAIADDDSFEPYFGRFRHISVEGDYFIMEPNSSYQINTLGDFKKQDNNGYSESQFYRLSAHLFWVLNDVSNPKDVEPYVIQETNNESFGISEPVYEVISKYGDKNYYFLR